MAALKLVGMITYELLVGFDSNLVWFFSLEVFLMICLTFRKNPLKTKWLLQPFKKKIDMVVVGSFKLMNFVYFLQT